MPTRGTQDFGCDRCWPADAEAAWRARADLGESEELIDGSHFHVKLLACARCRQRYVSIFTETIDWSDGEDPQYWTLLPITEAEASALVAERARLTESHLNALGRERRSLRRDHPKGLPPRVFWNQGATVGPHD